MSHSPLFIAIQDADLFGGPDAGHPLTEPSLFYDPPYDRPNCSKDYLSGEARETFDRRVAAGRRPPPRARR